MRQNPAVTFMLLLLLLVNGQLHAEKNDSSLVKYKWALQFRICKDALLESFEQGEISFKHQISPAAALRYGASIEYRYESLDKSHFFATDLSVMYQRYLNPNGIAKFYWAVGPCLLFDYSYYLDSGDVSYYQRTITGSGGGIFSAVGVEWFVTEVISIHAEYRGEASYEWRRYEYEYKEPGGVPNSTTSDVGIFTFSTFKDVLFGLSVYF